MNIFNKTDHNINLSILIFSLFIGFFSFSIYFILCIKSYNTIISSSYKISAKQLAESISISSKINNTPAIVKAAADSFITKNSIFVQIFDSEDYLFFSSPETGKNLSNTCKHHFSNEGIYYEDEKIGSIAYCYEIKYLSNTNNLIFKIIFLFAILSILSSSLNYFFIKKKNKPLYDLMFQIKKINPFSPSFGKIPKSIRNNQDLISIYNNIFQIISHIQKITLEKETMKSQVAIGQFTQMFAHDVRKPFNLMKMLFSNFEKNSSQIKNDEMNKLIMSELDKNISYVDSLIHDIMEIGKPNHLEISEVSFEDFVSKIISEMFLENTNITRIFNHRKTVHIDKYKITRVLVNIITNALEANKNKGKVWICSKDIKINDCDYIEVIIGNNGSYISEVDRSKLFEMFYTKNKKKGTGLGLAICKKIIEMHKGNIICSSHFMVGTEFIFTLPCVNFFEENI